MCNVRFMSFIFCLFLSKYVNYSSNLFIVTMFQRQKAISESDLYDCLVPRLDILCKPDGTKYKLVNKIFNLE